MQLHLGRKAPGQAVAGQGQHLAQLAQTHAGKGLGSLRRQADTLDGHAQQRRTGGIGVTHGQAIVSVGKHPRRHRVAGQDDALAQAQFRQFLAQACLEQRPGAEQLQAGAHLQQQRPWVVQADLGTEAVGPGCQQLLHLVDAPGVGFDAAEAIGQRTRRRQGLPGPQAERGRRRVDRLQHASLGRPAKQHQGGIRVVTLTQDRVQRQLREQDAGPEHVASAPPRAGDGQRRGHAATAFQHAPLCRAGVDGNAQRCG
ncbi:hypothetical protein D3C75_651130 [compost metagenome]